MLLPGVFEIFMNNRRIVFSRVVFMVFYSFDDVLRVFQETPCEVSDESRG
ncbi:MAG: hypothetical protein NZ941_01665 [Candidatus Caldarchaeum sp.]|nr:hypothetical protein [Candidatus Caldarchaeum sp.]MDW7977959.1 hypothetical protein [Candidatus Caldarchaeum sp.]